MPYIPNAPSVQLGTEKITLPNGQVVEVPKAFMNRMRYDASYANKDTGRMPTDTDILGSYFKTGKEGMYTAYSGIEDKLKQINKAYKGSGAAINLTSSYQKQSDYYKRYNEQQDRISKGGAGRLIRQTANGRVLSDTGQTVTRQDLQSQRPEINRQEREFQQAMGQDLQEFKQLGQSSTISNVPITVTRSKDPDVRGSMARHLKNLGAVTQTA